MNNRAGIRAFDKQGKQGYVITHSNKVLYPSPTSPTGLSTLTEILGGGSMGFETICDIENEYEDPIIDPIVKDYVDRLLANYITKTFTLSSDNWIAEGTHYKLEVPYGGIKPAMYPSYDLVPAGQFPTEIEKELFSHIFYIRTEEDYIIFYSDQSLSSNINVVVKGLCNEGGDVEDNISSIISSLTDRISILEDLISASAIRRKIINLESDVVTNTGGTVKTINISSNIETGYCVDEYYLLTQIKYNGSSNAEDAILGPIPCKIYPVSNSFTQYMGTIADDAHRITIHSVYMNSNKVIGWVPSYIGSSINSISIVGVDIRLVKEES